MKSEHLGGKGKEESGAGQTKREGEKHGIMEKQTGGRKEARGNIKAA